MRVVERNATPLLIAAVLVMGSVGTSRAAGPVSGGLSLDQVASVVKAHSRGLGACWDSAQEHDPQPRGDVTMAWQIDTSGAVTNASVVGTTVRSPRLGQCITVEVKGWRFPASDTPTTVSAFPFHFTDS